MINLLEYHKITKKQDEVDFLIPFLDLDRRYCLDPSLLRFSANSLLRKWSIEIDDFLKLVHHVMKGGDTDKLRRLLNIGEAPDAGLGYCAEGVSGSGVGKEISDQVIKILAKNDYFRKRGFFRLEELQWLDRNIGPDRISDLAINILKRNIIKYTQVQAKKHRIPTEKVRVQKIFDGDSLSWISGIEKLPINSKRIVKNADAVNKHPPLLLLPKEAVKALPLFLSYDEFYGFVDPTYKPGISPRKPKGVIVNTVIKNPKISSDFVKSRETQTEKLYRPDFDSSIHEHLTRLEGIPPGSKKHANEYRDTIKEILDFIFIDILEFYKKESPTSLGENRRDLIYRNNATGGVFSDMKAQHQATHIVVDTKNTDNVTAKDVAQVSNYLNDGIGNVAIIVSRKKDKKLHKHSVAQYAKQKKVLLFIADEDLKRWVTDKTRIKHDTGKLLPKTDATKSIQNMYSDIVTA